MSLPSRRHTLSALLALGLSGCASLLGPPTLRLSEDELDALLQQRLPLQRRVLELFDVSLPAGRLRLLPERERLALALDLQARERVLGGQWRGQMQLDAALRWQTQDHTVRLQQVRVQELRLDSSASPARGPAERLGAAVAGQLLEGLMVYQLPPDRVQRLQRQGLAPGALRITPRGLELDFVPSAG